jgi:pyridoxal phosphate enzyme (YggS family)
VTPRVASVPAPTRLATALETRLEALLARIARACRHAGRGPDCVRLVAVTKGAGPEEAAELVGLGQLDLGESRVQALEEKAAWLAARGLHPRWHLLGHLQRNKARRAVVLAEEIHSVDSLRLLETLERVAEEEGRRPRIYLELNLTGAAVRTGLPLGDLAAAIDAARELPHLELAGLMTMAPEPDAGAAPADGARAVFRRLRELRDALEPQRAAAFAQGRAQLSMGMSADFEQAIAEGADLVRVGSALVGRVGAGT